MIQDQDHGYARLLRTAAAQRRGAAVAVGIQGSDATKDHGGATMAEIAAVHEFGLGHVPERSFIRAWVDENRAAIETRLRNTAIEVQAGRIDAQGGLNRFGVWAVGQIRSRILAGIEPALKYREGTPLVDTGQLISSITALVLEALQ